MNSPQPATGAEQIARERMRQINEEGYTAEHDAQWKSGELPLAALSYIAFGHLESTQTLWPWDKSQWKPTDDGIRNLVKAGALIAAEIDRLQRRINTNDHADAAALGECG